MKLLINSILGVLIMGATLCCMTGCRQWKHIRKTDITLTSTKSDSVKIILSERVSAQKTKDVQREVRDTTVGIAPTGIVCEGCADTVIRKGNITLRTYTDSKGKRHTECLADSLTLVIRGLIWEREILVQSRDSIIKDSSFHASQGRESTSTVTEVVRQTNGGFIFAMKHTLYIVLAVFTGMALQKWIMPFIKSIIQHHGGIW